MPALRALDEIDRGYPRPHGRGYCMTALRGLSTNGVPVMGMHGIACIGFGPGNEVYAHMATEQIPVEQLVKAAAWYAAFPMVYSACQAS